MSKFERDPDASELPESDGKIRRYYRHIDQDGSDKLHMMVYTWDEAAADWEHPPELWLFDIDEKDEAENFLIYP